MRHRLWIAVCVVALAASAAGCKDKRTLAEPEEAMLEIPPVRTDGPLPTYRPIGGAPVATARQQYIAYTYNYHLELPVRKVLPLYEHHLTLCKKAGPNRCQVEQAETRNEEDGRVSANLRLRATPEWLDSFRAQLSKDTSAADGRIAWLHMTRDDLSRSIIDTQAYLRAQTALRDRLQKLLDSRPGKLSELLETERELARVQGDLDSAHSRLAHLQQRVTMSQMALNYHTDQSSMTWQGRRASDYFKNLWEKMRDSFLTMIQVTAVVLPWLLPLGLVIWGLRKLWVATRKARLAAKARREADAAAQTTPGSG